MKAEKFENVDISSATALFMAPKEDSEIITVKKACLVTVDVFTKYLKDQIMEIIDSDKVSNVTPYFAICKLLEHLFKIWKCLFSESKTLQTGRRCRSCYYR